MASLKSVSKLAVFSFCSFSISSGAIFSFLIASLNQARLFSFSDSASSVTGSSLFSSNCFLIISSSSILFVSSSIICLFFLTPSSSSKIAFFRLLSSSSVKTSAGTSLFFLSSASRIFNSSPFFLNTSCLFLASSIFNFFSHPINSLVCRFSNPFLIPSISCSYFSLIPAFRLSNSLSNSHPSILISFCFLSSLICLSKSFSYLSVISSF